MDNIIKKLALVNNLDQLPNKVLVNGRNIELDKNLVTINNAQGNELLFSTTHPICGIIASQTSLVVFSTDDANQSEIGIYKEGGAYETIVIGAFGFKVDNPITGVIDYNIKGDLIVGWTNGIVPIGVLNVDNLPFTLPITKIATATELNLCKLFPDSLVPTVDIKDVSSGGNMLTGTVQFTIGYKLRNGDTTNWLNITNTIPIGDVNLGSVYKYVNTSTGEYDSVPINNAGVDAIQETDLEYVSKNVRIDVSNLDPRYDTIIVAAIHQHKGGTFVYEVGSYDVTGMSTKSIIYDGNYINDLSIDTIATGTITYTTCKTMTTVGGRLLLGNVTIPDVIDYQPFANAIEVSWDTKVLTHDVNIITDNRGVAVSDDKGIYCHINPLNAAKFKSLMPDDVYALYVTTILTDGSIGKAYHIPGRVAEALPIPTVTIPSPITGTMTLIAYENTSLSFGSLFKGKKYDVARSVSEDAKYFQMFDTASNAITNGTERNKLGYWENAGELYPNHESYIVKEVDDEGNPIVIGDLRNSKIRHHKMPSYNVIYNEGEDITKSIYLKFHNINIPKDLHGKIQGLRFYYAERDSANMTVLGEYPLVSNSFYDKDGEASNYTYGQRRNSTVKEYEYKTYDDNVVRFNDYSLLTTKPALTVNYLKLQYVSNNEREGLVTLEDYPDKDGDYTKLINTWSYNYNKFSTRLSNYSSDHRPSSTEQIPIIPIVSALYTPNDNAASTPSNKGRETTALITLTDLDYHTWLYDKCIISTVNKLIHNAYTNHTNRKLVATDSILFLQPNVFKYDDIEVHGFDVCINSYRSVLYRGDKSIVDPETFERADDFELYSNAIVSDLKFVSYSIFNVPYRVRPNDESYKTEYENNPLLSSILPDLSNIFNVYEESVYLESNFNLNPSIDILPTYDLSYSSVNNVKSIITYDIIDPVVSTLPNRIPRSNIQGGESLDIAWRLFNPLDYYDIVKDKGGIVSLQSINKGVMIQTTYSLFRAIVKDKLMTLDAETYLGTGDLFDREPDELLPTTHGYIGCISPLTILLDELGYFVFDANTNRAFIISNDDIKEITNQFVKEYFDRVLESTGSSPVGQKMIAALDPIKHKLIISNPTDIPFTINYHNGSDDLGFISKDDYIPHLFATTRTNLYSVDYANKNKVYIHNANNRGTWYGTKSNSKVAVIFNVGQEAELYNIAIKSDVIKNRNKINKTFDKLLIYNQHQSSGNIDLEVFDGIDDYDKIRNIGNTWYFNYFRDMAIDGNNSLIDEDGESIDSNINKSKEWYEQSPFISNLIVVQMEFDNSDDEELHFNDVNINVDLFNR